MGVQTGRNNQMYSFARPPDEGWAKMGLYYKDLLRCHWEFARPYLGYGEMLRPPKIEGDFPTVTGQVPGGEIFTLKAVEGSAWRAPDGTVGIFFLNYDTKGHEFTWTTDLNEFAGLDGLKKLKVTRWSAEKGEEAMDIWAGGLVGKTMTIEPWGLIALKLAEVQ